VTLPNERTSSILRTRQFLLRLSTPYGGGIKGVKKEVREEARRLLRHYPGVWEMQQASEALPDVFWLQPNEVPYDAG
jgi:hypothetical protein